MEVLELKAIEENYPERYIESYGETFKLPFLYHYYYLSSKKVLNYVHYYRRIKMIIKELRLEENKDCACVDIGCDWGLLLMTLWKKYPQVRCYGVDIDEYSCEFGNRLATANNLEIKLQYANSKKLPFDDNSIDYITSMETFEHILPEWREATVKEMYRILKPKGRIVITFPNPYGLSQIAKDFISRTRLSNFCKFLPNVKSHEVMTVPTSTNDGDVMSLTESMTKAEVYKLFENAGFKIINDGRFVFMYEFAPNILFNFFLIIEILLEALPLTKYFCTSQFFTIEKTE